MVESVSFDRAAKTYDETRGGIERGRANAVEIDRHLLPESRVLEIGVGTGLVAGPLGDLGHHVVGIDLSRAMLDRAADRLPRLVEADASLLPVGNDAVDGVVAVWAIHVIGDLEALMAEVVRVLRPGGLLLHVSATPDVNAHDLHDLGYSLGSALDREWDRSPSLAPRLAPLGLHFEGDVGIVDDPFERTPNDHADRLEARQSSSLWDLDDHTWQRVVQPIIDGLRALPEPDRPRNCQHTHLLSTYRLVS